MVMIESKQLGVETISRRQWLRFTAASLTLPLPSIENGPIQEFKEVNNFGELDTYFRTLDATIGITDIYNPDLSEDAIRNIRNERTKLNSPKRLCFIISDTLWQRIVKKGQTEVPDRSRSPAGPPA